MNKTTQVLFFFLWMSVSAFVNAAGVIERQIDTQDDIDLASLRQQVAQKLFIDLRYYCETEATGHCQQAVVSLPDTLSSMLTTSQVGGVILFSENLQSAKQILALNASLQQAALSLRGAFS